MAEKKKPTRRKKSSGPSSLLPKMEVIFIVVMVICFFAWALTKCSKSPTPPVVEDEPEETTSPAAADNPASPTYDMGQNNTSASAGTTTQPPSGNPQVVGRNESSNNRNYTPLYVTLQDLKVRRGPSRDSTIITRLNLHEQVFFLEKRTDFKEKISNGSEIMDEPWYFIKTQRGHQGWVYGGGVHFFKWDRMNDPISNRNGEEIPE